MVGVVQTRQGAVVRVIGQGAGQGRQHTRLGQTHMRTHRTPGRRHAGAGLELEGTKRGGRTGTRKEGGEKRGGEKGGRQKGGEKGEEVYGRGEEAEERREVGGGKREEISGKWEGAGRYSTADPHPGPASPKRNQHEQWQSSKESWFTFFWWLTLRASTRAAMSPQSSHPLYLVWVTGVPMNGSSTGDPAASYSTTYEGHGMTERGSVDLCATA
jgi:hypothetical protein